MPVAKAPRRRAKAPDAVELALAGVATANQGAEQESQRRKRDEKPDAHRIATSNCASSSSNRDVRIATVAVQSPGAAKVAAGAV